MPKLLQRRDFPPSARRSHRAKQLYADEGYQDATITPSESPVQGVAKLVILTYQIDQGPQLKIKEVVFDGAKIKLL